MRIGVLTGGGDAPGLNGVLESLVRVLAKSNIEVVGIRDGFEGVYKNETVILTPASLQGVHVVAGSLLGASNKSRITGREDEFRKAFGALRLDGLVAMGGDGTFAALKSLLNSVPLIGVPKTIDNDLAGTEMTFGYDTACEVISSAIQSLRATAETHRRILLVETMGRTAGWLALGGGLAGYADAILLPERPFSRPDFLAFLRAQQKQNRRGLVVCVAEGAHAKGERPEIQFQVPESVEPARYGGVSFAIARWIEREIQWESRNVVLGHLQRSQNPTATDRFLTLAMGVTAAHLVERKDWGKAVVFRQGRVVATDINDLMQPARQVPAKHHWIGFAQDLGLFV